MAHPPSFVLARPACCFRRQDNTGGFNDDKLKANGESLVEEESIDEYVVERRKRSRWARAKRRFGRGKQTTSCAYKTDRPILDWRLAVGSQATASPLNAWRFVEFSLFVLSG